MRATRAAFFAIIGTAFGVTSSGAQTLQPTTPPAELPPESFDGKQYVDSKGCIYIRAGIDGQVTWVPRVTRDRKHVCGYKPSLASSPVAQPATPVAPAVVEAKDVPVAPAPVAAPVAAPSKPASRAPAKVRRAKPVAPAPVALVALGPDGTLFPETTRIVPKHVYENRRNTTGVKVPKGYRPVWDDDRLNPRRAEITLAPAVPVTARTFKVPRGFRVVHREDDRLNPKRGLHSAQGDAQTDQIWDNSVPRRLKQLPADRPVYQLPDDRRLIAATADSEGFLRVSSRSAPVADTPDAKQRYVRVSTHQTQAEAQQVVEQLQAVGLPVRYGKLMRRSAEYKVVLAGPFASDASARAALSAVRNAGYRKARLTK